MNVYIDPGSWVHWKRTEEFRESTIIIKELVSVGAKQSASGNGYFQGEFLGIAAAVKSKRRSPNAPNNWGYYAFEGEGKTTRAQADTACAACHKENAEHDMVFTQHYPVLRAAAAINKAPKHKQSVGTRSR